LSQKQRFCVVGYRITKGTNMSLNRADVKNGVFGTKARKKLSNGLSGGADAG